MECSYLSSRRWFFVVPLLVLSTSFSNAADSLAAPPSGFTFNGKWECTGNIPGSDKPREHRATYEGKMAAEGAWIELSYLDIDPAGYAANFLIGWDVNKKQVVTFIADNKGYAMLTGPGWQGKSLTLTRTGLFSFEGFTDATMPISRVTLEFKSPNLFTTTWQVKKGDEWENDDFLSCKAPNPRTTGPSSFKIITSVMVEEVIHATLAISAWYRLLRPRAFVCPSTRFIVVCENGSPLPDYVTPSSQLLTAGNQTVNYKGRGHFLRMQPTPSPCPSQRLFRCGSSERNHCGVWIPLSAPKMIPESLKTAEGLEPPTL